MKAKTTKLTTVADTLGIRRRTLQDWCAKGRVEHSRYPTGRICFTDAQIQMLVASITPAESHPEVETPNPLYEPDPMAPVVVPIRRAG